MLQEAWRVLERKQIGRTEHDAPHFPILVIILPMPIPGQDDQDPSRCATATQLSVYRLVVNAGAGLEMLPASQKTD